MFAPEKTSQTHGEQFDQANENAFLTDERQTEGTQGEYQYNHRAANCIELLGAFLMQAVGFLVLHLGIQRRTRVIGIVIGLLFPEFKLLGAYDEFFLLELQVS